MKVTLKTITPDAEEIIVEIARVSSNRTNKKEDPEKLIAHLIKYGHWSPFEQANMIIEIECSLVVATQILRHKSMSFQQFSQRYAEVNTIEPITFYYENEGFNRQTSSDQELDNEELLEEITAHFFSSLGLYKKLREHKVSRETARYILPQATTTKLYCNGSIRSWIHYLQQRTKKEFVQVEHYEVAKKVEVIFKEKLPNIYQAIVKENLI